MIILGIDPGTACTGWGVIEVVGNSYHLLSFGTIKAKTKILSEKYVIIFDSINQIIDTYHPDYISVETQFVDKNVQSAIKLGMARGMAVLAGAKRQIPIYEYAPLKAKQAVSGSGNASKEHVQKMISILLNLSETVPHDAADGLALAICHAHFARAKASLPI